MNFSRCPASQGFAARRTDRRPILPAMIKRIAIATFLLCLLAACGNKGPLVMPEAKPADAPATVKPAEQPAAAEPAKTESGTPAR